MTAASISPFFDSEVSDKVNDSYWRAEFPLSNDRANVSIDTFTVIENVKTGNSERSKRARVVIIRDYASCLLD